MISPGNIGNQVSWNHFIKIFLIHNPDSLEDDFVIGLSVFMVFDEILELCSESAVR